MTRWARSILLIALFLLPVLSYPAVPKKNASQRRPSSEDLAAKARRTLELDEAALAVKSRAAATFARTFNLHIKNAQTPGIDLSYGELLQDIAAIQYRIAFARGTSLSKSTNTMKLSLVPLNELISKFPKSPEVKRAYYLRGKAYLELEQKDAAMADFLYLTQKWPTIPEATLASVSLWDLLMEKKDYRQVVTLIRRYGLRPGSKIYGMALDRLGWAYYNLNEVPTAIATAGSLIAYNRNRSEAEREKAISSLAFFYANGVSVKNPGVPPAEVVNCFRKYVAPADLETAYSRYALAMRSKGMDAELEALPGILASEPVSDNLKIEIYLNLFENQLNTLRYVQLKDTTLNLIQLLRKDQGYLRDPKHAERVKNDFIGGIKKLQQLITQRKKSYNLTETTRAASETLTALYYYNVQLAADDTTKAKTYFNMAELDLQNKDYAGAAQAYRWVVSKMSLQKPDQAKFYKEASLNSIGAEHELLKQKKLIPSELKAKPLSTPSTELDPEQSRWMSWVDEYEKTLPLDQSSEAFYFETARILYSHGRIKDAIERLDHFAMKYPTSSFALPGVSLVMDTYIASEQWKETYAAAAKYLKNDAWKKNTEFQKLLANIEADSYFKIVEGEYKKGEYKAVLADGDKFLQANPQNRRRAEFLELLANASIASGDKRRSLQYFNAMRASGVKDAAADATAYLTAASLDEEGYQYDDAVGNFLNYLAVETSSKQGDPKELNNIRVKILIYAGISGNPALLQKVYMSPFVCSSRDPEVATECEKARVYLTMVQPPSPASSRRFFQQAQAGGPLAGLYSDAALLSSRDTRSGTAAYPLYPGYREKISLINLLAANWDKQDAGTKLGFYGLVTEFATQALAQIRSDVKRLRVSLDKTAIQKRVKRVEQAEQEIAAVAALPIAQVRILALLVASNLYIDLAAEIRALPAPAGLTGADLQAYQGTLNDICSPFDQKWKDLEKQAIEIAAQTGVDAPSVVSLHGPAPVPPLAIAPRINMDLLNAVQLPSDKAENLKLRQMVLKSLQEAASKHNWPKMAFMIQEAQRLRDRQIFPPEVPLLMQAISLNLVGATAEALDILAGVKSPHSFFLVFAGFCNARAKNKARDWIERANGDLQDADSAWFGKARTWIQSDDSVEQQPESSSTPKPGVSPAAEKGDEQ